MPSYTGQQSYLPSLQPFNPDFNYYSQVLDVKNNQFQQGLNKINSIYGSALNSPMIREDNLQRRSDFFKSVTRNLEKISRLDLSVEQNQQQAKSLFDPVLNDKYIIKDMSYTRQLQNSFKTAEQYRNCIDPEKCGGGFWDVGVQALSYAADEYKNAAPDEALNHKAPSYVPFQNLTEKAIKAAKASGLNVSYDHVEGRYLVTDTNGQMILGKDGQGVLPQYLLGVFGNDPSIQAMYNTQAYVQRKSFSKQFALENGVSEDQAEGVYLNKIMHQAVLKSQRSKADLENIQSSLKTNAGALNILASKSVPGDGIQDEFQSLQALIAASDKSMEYHDKVEKTIQSTPNLNDLASMRGRADKIVANSILLDEIGKASAIYAMGTAKHEIKGADPYALAAYHSGLDLSKSAKLKQLDEHYWIEQNLLEGKIDPRDAAKFGYQVPQELYSTALGVLAKNKMTASIAPKIIEALLSKNIKMTDLYSMGIDEANVGTPESIIKLEVAGLLNPTEAHSVRSNIPVAGVVTTNKYDNNVEVTKNAQDKAQSTSTDYLTSTVANMRQAYKQALSNPDDKVSKGIQAKILGDARRYFAGTGLSYIDMIAGNVSLDKLKGITNPEKMAKLIMDYQVMDKSSAVYNSGWDDQDVVKLQTALSAASGLANERVALQKEAVDNLNATIKTKTGDSVTGLEYYLGSGGHRDLPEYNNYIKQKLLVESMFDEQGNKRPVTDALNRFTRSSAHLFGIHPQYNDNGAIVGYASSAASGVKRQPHEFVHDYFKEHYGAVDQTYDSSLKDLTAHPLSNGGGGAQAASKGIALTVNGDQRFDGDYLSAKNIFNSFSEIDRNIGPLHAYKQEGTSLVEFGPSRNLASKVMDAFQKGETKNMNLDVEVTPLSKGEMAVSVNVDEPTFRELMGPESGIKPSEPVPEELRKFIIKAPEALPSFDFINSRLANTPEDILLRTPGQSIDVKIPGKGSYTLRNQKGQLWMDAYAYSFDINTGTQKLVQLPSAPLIHSDASGRSDALKADEVYTVADAAKIATSKLNDAYSILMRKKEVYLNNMAKHGQEAGAQ